MNLAREFGRDYFSVRLVSFVFTVHAAGPLTFGNVRLYNHGLPGFFRASPHSDGKGIT